MIRETIEISCKNRP